MKTQKNLFFLILTILFVFEVGCNTPKPTPNPLEGFHFSSLNNLHSNKAIMDDYQAYIQKLPPEEGKYAGPIEYFEDGTGQHAVQITIGINSKVWRHVLIYGEDDKRIKTVKYVSGDYHS